MNRQAVDGAVLTDDDTGVDRDDVPAGEGFADDAACLGIKVGLIIGRNEDGSVDDEEIGVGGWQSLVIIVASPRHREWLDAILRIGVTECLQFLLQSEEVGMLLVGSIGALYI